MYFDIVGSELACVTDGTKLLEILDLSARLCTRIRARAMIIGLLKFADQVEGNSERVPVIRRFLGGRNKDIGRRYKLGLDYVFNTG